MKLRDLLNHAGVDYQWTQHPATYTSQDLASRMHESGHHVIKPVKLEVDGEPIMAAIPASAMLDTARVRQWLNADSVRLADEKSMQQTCSDCEVGAEPPIGTLFGVKTLMDDTLCSEDRICFQAGTHRDAVIMHLDDYLKLTQPRIGHIITDA